MQKMSILSNICALSQSKSTFLSEFLLKSARSVHFLEDIHRSSQVLAMSCACSTDA